MARIVAYLLCLAATVVNVSPASARNLALVIGNDGYRNIPKLTKAVGDARAMQAALGSIGFTVLAAENATYAETAGLIATLESQVRPGDTVLFHFSGQGIAIDGDDFILPVDVPRPEAGQEAVVASSAFSAAKIIDTLRARGADVVVGVLDASRWNPFATAGVWNIGEVRGLVPIDVPIGSFVIYSAAPGQTSLDLLSPDDRDASSVFIRVLTDVIQQPGASLVEIAKETQLRVRNLTTVAGHEQVPTYEDRVVGNFVLLPEPAGGDVSGMSGDLALSPAEVQIASVVPVPFASDDPTLRANHGDWQIRCDVPEGEKDEQCVLMQFVTAEDRDNVGLTVIFLKAPGNAHIMRVVAPGGVFLPSGLGLKIDEDEIGRTGFVRCLSNGCVAEVNVQDDLLGKLKSGATATFIIYQTAGEGIGIPISLNGFGPGYDTLPQ